MRRDYIWALNSVNKCRECAYFAKNKNISDVWNKIADQLELKYLSGQPWLLTYDGKLK